MFLWTIIVLFISFLSLSYVYFRKKFSYWEDLGIKYKPFSVREVVNALFLRKKPFHELIIDQYNEFRDDKERYIGFFQFTTPFLLITDLALIKQLTIKDFDHFTDHKSVIDAVNADVLFSKNLVALKGQEWREMRNLLSPAFTGSKMRSMFGLIHECAQKLTQHFVDKKSETDTIELELKDVFTKYTNDVIATSAFGFSCNSLENPDNEFFRMGSDVININFSKIVKSMIMILTPQIAKLLRFTVLTKEVEAFFLRIIRETIKYRLENDVVRPDMVQLLLDAQKGRASNDEKVDQRGSGSSIKKDAQQREISDFDIAAQGFIFFLAGFETSSVIMSFVGLELAVNRDCQVKLIEEIDRVLEANKGAPQLTYENIMEMKYLDMVISETLRKWPATPVLDRACTQDFTIESTNETERPLKLNKGDWVMFPILGVHMNEKFHPNPERFDPERFNDENRKIMNPDTYFPFGLGPRACIGSRFALLEIKVLFVCLLSRFELTVVEKTSVPIKLSIKSLKTVPESEGFHVGLKLRRK